MQRSIMVSRFLNWLIISVRFQTYHIFWSLLITSGVRIEYLPPYSPDLNPIKEAFSKIKHWLRRYQDYYNATTGDGILFDVYEILDIVTAEDAEGYFVHAGYF
jgi:transposase